LALTPWVLSFIANRRVVEAVPALAAMVATRAVAISDATKRRMLT
jgi:hypothetical protein